MAHEIRESDRFGYVGEPAWHGLGASLPSGLTAVEGFKRLGLDWTTELLPLNAQLANGATIPLVEHRAHIRCDTNDVLGVVSDGYKPIDNGDLAAFADAVMGSGPAGIDEQGNVVQAPVAALETAGSLYGGKRVFALLRLPTDVVVAQGKGGFCDNLATYLALTNGHGGTASFTCSPTAIRIVCANTLRLAERDMTRGVRFMHTGDLEGKLRSAKLALGFAAQELNKLAEQARALAKTSFDHQQVADYFATVFDATFPAPSDDEASEPRARWLKKRAEVIGEWQTLFANERNEQLVGASAWSALNAVTEWHDHERGRFGRVAESDARVHSNLFGVSHQAKGKALRLALATV